jgi:MFS family permease
VGAFIGIQVWKGEAATVPPRIVKHRSILASLWFGFFQGAALFVLMYYMPIWFQAVKGVTAIRSGIMLLPLILSTVVAVMASGVLVSKIGYCAPFFLASAVLSPIGAGLLTTLKPDSGAGEWIGYQILCGFGMGLGAQQPMTVAQTVLGRSDIASGTAVMMFMRLMGSTIFVPVAQNLYLNGLVSRLTDLPNIDANAVVNGGATNIRHLANGADLKTLIADYNGAVVDTFYLTVSVLCVIVLGAVCVEWTNIKKAAEAQKAEQSPKKEEEKASEGQSKEEAV